MLRFLLFAVSSALLLSSPCAVSATSSHSPLSHPSTSTSTSTSASPLPASTRFHKLVDQLRVLRSELQDFQSDRGNQYSSPQLQELDQDTAVPDDARERGETPDESEEEEEQNGDEGDDDDGSGLTQADSDSAEGLFGPSWEDAHAYKQAVKLTRAAEMAQLHPSILSLLHAHENLLKDHVNSGLDSLIGYHPSHYLKAQAHDEFLRESGYAGALGLGGYNTNSVYNHYNTGNLGTSYTTVHTSYAPAMTNYVH